MENRVYNEGQYEQNAGDDNFWRTSNDVVAKREEVVEPAGKELGNSLRAESSFHPLQHGQYNLWLDNEKNEEFFRKTPRYLKKMQESQMVKNMNNRSRKVRRR